MGRTSLDYYVIVRVEQAFQSFKASTPNVVLIKTAGSYPLFIVIMGVASIVLLLLLVVANTRSSSSFSFVASSLLVRGIVTKEDEEVVRGTPRHNIPVVICPGFGNSQLDYINPKNMGVDRGFVASLTRRGFSPHLIKVLPIQRFEWFRVAGGLFDSNFWACKADPNGIAYGWYVKRLRQAIEEMHQKSGGEKCILLCHSAGGW